MITNLFSNMRLQRKLTLITLLITGTVMLVACVALFLFQSIHFQETYVRDMKALADMLANNTTAAITFNDTHSAEEILNALKVKPHVIGAEIQLPNGATAARYGQAKPEVYSILAEFDNRDEHRFAKDLFVLSKSIHLDGKKIGTLRVWSDYGADYWSLFQLYTRILLAVLGVSLGLSYVLSKTLQRFISRPILTLADTAKAVAESNDYTVRAEQMGTDEVGLLTAAFNRMLGRVAAQDADLRLSRQKFESLVNSLNGIVWEADPITLGTLFVSPQAESILGYSLEECLRNPNFWEEHRHPDDRERMPASLRAQIQTGKPFHLEYRMLHASGRTVWLHDNINILFQDGKAQLLRGVTVDITAQKEAQKELEGAQKKLVEASRLAGMAEVATGVLHNVGNVLNSVNVSASLVQEQVKRSQINNFVKAANLLREHAADMAAFILQDARGQKLPGFLIKLSDQLAAEQRRWMEELRGLCKHIEHIKEIVNMQQSYARISGVTEPLSAVSLVEDALRLNAGAFERHGISLVREFSEAPLVEVDKHKVLQILTNLISNAKYAMEAPGHIGKTLTVAISTTESGRVGIHVRDQGLGIEPENLTRIFQHGFTTKKQGHGFGLHSSANAAREMKGFLFAHSQGHGTGATFILELPLAKTTAPEVSPPQTSMQTLLIPSL